MAETGKDPLVIAECGFGFGINFLLTCEYFCRLAREQARLHFISCELHPVRRDDLEKFHRQLPLRFREFSRHLLKAYTEQGKGLHRLTFNIDKHQITLDLVYGEALEAFTQLCMPSPLVDAWYLDGFAPLHNQAMWNRKLFLALARISKHGATFATYSASGVVRRNLEAAGFITEKIKGFGQKRHMLTGEFECSDRVSTNMPVSWRNPWAEKPPKTRTVGIIGAGLAGCCTAYALALKGYAVTVFEKNFQIACEASGNPRGIVHFKPSRQIDTVARFRLSAFDYAVRHYKALAEKQDFQWNPCGMIQLAVTEKELAFQYSLISRGLYDPALLFLASREEVSKLADIPIQHSGICFPLTGSLDPAALCSAWISNENISLKTAHRVSGYEYEDRQWKVQANTARQSNTESFDALVLCSNAGTHQLPELPNYPLITNHGQTDTYTSSVAPLTMLCHQGYVIPWQDGHNSLLTIGGSFGQGGHVQSTDGTEKNRVLIKKISAPLFEELESQKDTVSSHYGTRVTTQDYLPLAGPVENDQSCRQIFAGYRRNARKHIESTGEYIPGLYVNVAHGSNGLTTIPLLADYLASLVSGDSLPLTDGEISAIHPLRFLVRDLKRQK